MKGVSKKEAMRLFKKLLDNYDIDDMVIKNQLVNILPEPGDRWADCEPSGEIRIEIVCRSKEPKYFKRVSKEEYQNFLAESKKTFKRNKKEAKQKLIAQKEWLDKEYEISYGNGKREIQLDYSESPFIEKPI